MSGNLYNCQTTSDFTIVCEDKKIYVHKLILSNFSEFYKNKFSGQWKDEKELPVSLFKPYEFLMKYIYFKNINLNEYKFTSDELYELLTYIDSQIILDYDITLRNLIIQIINECKFDETYDIELICLIYEIFFKKYDKYLSISWKILHLPLQVFSHITFDQYELIKKDLSFEQELYVALQLIKKHIYGPINSISLEALRKYLSGEISGEIFDILPHAFNSYELSLLLEIFYVSIERIYPLKCLMELGTVEYHNNYVMEIKKLNCSIKKNKKLLIVKNDGKIICDIIDLGLIYYINKEKQVCYGKDKVYKHFHVCIKVDHDLGSCFYINDIKAYILYEQVIEPIQS
jgi:BTB/POZ domain